MTDIYLEYFQFKSRTKNRIVYFKFPTFNTRYCLEFSQKVLKNYNVPVSLESTKLAKNKITNSPLEKFYTAFT